MVELVSIPEHLPSPFQSYEAQWDVCIAALEEEVLSQASSECSSAAAVRVPVEYLCPISLQRLMKAPVRLLQTGATCDRDTFLQYLTSGGMQCPVTGELLKQPVAMRPNYLLQYEIATWAAATGIPYMPASYEAQECTQITATLKPSGKRSMSRMLRAASNLLGT